MTSSEERKCTRCSFKAPLDTWKLKVKGVPGKWCENCCDWARKKDTQIQEQKREDRISLYEHLNGPMGSGGGNGVEACRRLYVEHCVREGIDIVKADARRDRQHEKWNRFSRCPGCDKEMHTTNLASHQAKYSKAEVHNQSLINI